jgi:fatty-acid desaturase
MFIQTDGATTSFRQGRSDFLSVVAINFIILHLACPLVLWMEFSWPALAAGVVCYLVRMFGVTAGFHRYFSHRAYRTSRAFQFLLVWLGASAGQRGPLWWAPCPYRKVRLSFFSYTYSHLVFTVNLPLLTIPIR